MNPQAIPEAENSAGSASRTTPRDEAGAPRITVSRGDLAAAVAHAGRAHPKRAALPVLTGMRAEVTGSRLTLATFDYEMAARASIDGSAAAPGAILADGPQLAAAVKALPRGNSAAVTLEAGTGALTLECEGARSTVPLLAHPEDHPGLPDLPPAAGIRRAGRLCGRGEPVSVGFAPAGVTVCPVRDGAEMRQPDRARHAGRAAGPDRVQPGVPGQHARRGRRRRAHIADRADEAGPDHRRERRRPVPRGHRAYAVREERVTLGLKASAAGSREQTARRAGQPGSTPCGIPRKSGRRCSHDSGEPDARPSVLRR
jgi:DNA polymerase III beta subunit-like protein